MAGRNSLLLLLVSGTFMMETLDSAMIATPLPLIARDLGVDPVDAKGALTSYFLAVAALLPLSNWLSDRFGPRRIFAAAIAIFLAGSLLCAVAPTLTVLVAARVIQGAAGAMMFPIGRMILVQSVSKQDLVRMLSSASILPSLALVVGPLLAGYVATFLDWRILFLINGPHRPCCARAFALPCPESFRHAKRSFRWCRVPALLRRDRCDRMWPWRPWRTDHH